MKVFRITFLLFALAPIPSSVAQQASSHSGQANDGTEMAKYIGLRRGPALPDNLKDIGGALISELDDASEYGIAEVHKGRVKMLWLERLTHRDVAGKPYWEVKDILILPPIRRNQILVYAFCYTGERPDKEIVAVADHQPDVEYFTRIRRAWRANRRTGKFEVIPPKGIKCGNEGYGV